MSYTGHLLGEFSPLAEMQPAYSAASTDWALPREEKALEIKGDSDTNCSWWALNSPQGSVNYSEDDKKN